MEELLRTAERELEPLLDTLQNESFFADDAQQSNQRFFATTPVESWSYDYIKPVWDVSLALVLLVLFAIPGLLIAAAILFTSKGGIFYREERIGRQGQPFRIWKFRSMHANRKTHDAGGSSLHTVIEFDRRTRKHLGDKRITMVGKFLRRWSLDEFPQLLNVLRGEMSLVGPRPIVRSEMGLYGTRIHYYLKATPGLSGLWQVSGRSLLSYDQRAKLDAIYVQSWTLGTDLFILFRTIPAVLGRIGAF
jgi:exopolysaccharide production protein ExoY